MPQTSAPIIPVVIGFAVVGACFTVAVYRILTIYGVL